MESRRLVRPSSFPPTPSGLEDSNLQGSRLPLTESAGNTASRTLASVDVYHDHKGLPPLSGENFHSHYLQPPILHSSTNVYPHPSLNHPHVVVPSQPPPPHVSSLGQRKRQHQRRRDERQRELDIRDSEQYKQYRQRQTRDGQDKDQKWSDDLEEAFLDAQRDLPIMGRRKFTYNSKPYGRNELISEYLWIAHIKSLAPGQLPDESKRRTRKQVSSHIQVLKTFLKSHPDAHYYFGSGRRAHEIQDSLRDDPCLMAIANHELPPWRREKYYYSASMVVPKRFALWITHGHPEAEDEIKQESQTQHSAEPHADKWYTFTQFEPRPGPRRPLESFPNWRKRFPALDRLDMSGELSCDMIQMDTTLQLPPRALPRHANLCASFDIQPTTADPHAEWYSVTTLYKPSKLHGNPDHDPPVQQREELASPTERNGSTIRISFPAVQWAHAIQSLMTMQKEHEEYARAGVSLNTRDYIRQISMYQEIFCRSGGRGVHQERKAVILWTFDQAKVRDGIPDEGKTNWWYLDGRPPRNAVMSPSPVDHHGVGSSHNHISASIDSNLAWADQGGHNSLGLDLPGLGMPDPFQDLSPHDSEPHQQLAAAVSGALQSPFMAHHYGYGNGQAHAQNEGHGQQLSFISEADSDSTLVNGDNGGSLRSGLDHNDQVGDANGNITQQIDHYLAQGFEQGGVGVNGWLPEGMGAAGFGGGDSWQGYEGMGGGAAVTGWESGELKGESWSGESGVTAFAMQESHYGA